MIEKQNAQKVVEVIANNLYGVAKDTKNFEKLPDIFWGYYARGHDSNGKFGVIITYSESEKDVDDLIAKYEDWLKENKKKSEKQ